MNWADAGRFLVVAGAVIVVIGMFFMIADKIPLGRLPGDLHFGGGRFRIYIPIVTCLLLSAAITIILNFFSRR
jgi:K+ transporter